MTIRKKVKKKPSRRVRPPLRDRIPKDSLLRSAAAAMKIALLAGFLLLAAYLSPGVGRTWQHLLRTNDVLVVKKIILEGHRLVTEEEILEKIGVAAGHFIADISLEDIALELEELPQIREVLVKKHYPSAIYVRIRERTPLFIAGDGPGWLVSEEGMILGSAGRWDGDLPRVSGLDTSGGRLTDGRSLEVVDRLRSAVAEAGLDWPGMCSFLDISDGETPMVRLHGTIPVYLGSEGYKQKIIRLASVLPRLEEAGLAVSYIDLRFSQRVVVGTGQDGEPFNEEQVGGFG
jgi:cell division septal protein FtsQ